MISNLLSTVARYAAPIGLLVLSLGATVAAKAESTAADALPGHTIADTAAGIREEKADLTLREAVGLALKLNPELAASAKEIGALEGVTLQAGLLRNPELAIDVEDISAPQGQGLQRFSTIRLGQVIELGGKRQARVAATSLAQDVARQDYEARRLELLARVANGFTDVLAAQERTRLAEESVRLAQDVVNAVGKRVQAGKAPPIEETKAKVTLSTARIEVEQAQRDLVWCPINMEHNSCMHFGHSLAGERPDEQTEEVRDRVECAGTQGTGGAVALAHAGCGGGTPGGHCAGLGGRGVEQFDRTASADLGQLGRALAASLHGVRYCGAVRRAAPRAPAPTRR